MPSQASTGMTSLNNTHASNAANGGTRKNSADTRATSPARIIASNSPTAITELPITR